jgi:hypothetical protein
MSASPFRIRSSNKAAALIIVLAFVVLLTGLSLTYFSRTTSERQLAHSSYNDTDADLLARAALDIVVSNLQREIADGSSSTIFADGSTGYKPLLPAYMVPQRSGNAAGVPNLIRRSVRSDPILSPPGQPSSASAVSSQDNPSVNGRSITSTRWNGHYLVPKKNTGPGQDDATPIDAFTNATPDWAFVTGNGPTVITVPDPTVIGRYAYAVYAEDGLLDMNVAGYPTGTTTAQSGRKGVLGYADLTPTSGVNIPQTQVDNIVGWRNYASTQQTGSFGNFSFTPAQALLYFTSIINNTNGFLAANTPAPTSTPTPTPWNNRTDQMFLQRQELISFRAATQFSSNALQYLSTFSRETNAPSFSPTIATAINPNFLLIRVTGAFTRFDGTSAVVGEPLVKTRFPLGRLAWMTYKGPSAVVYAANPNDPVILALTAAGVSTTTIQAGTANNIKKCFGLTFGGNAGDPWTYTNPVGISAASAILSLDQVAAAGREPDLFELLQAGILSGSLGQNTGGGVTGGNVFPDIHMSSTTHHILSIGAAIIDQADPDSIPTRIQFSPDGVKTWTAYGVESLPYLAQIYPIAGAKPPNSTTLWATYLLFQLWNPHVGGALPTPAPQVRLRVDGNVGIFRSGNSETWTTDPSHNLTCAFPSGGVSITLTAGAFPQTLPSPTPAAVGTPGVQSVPAVDSATAPGGFERLPGTGVNSLTNYVGLRLLPDYQISQPPSGIPQLNLYLGTDSTHPFNATMEYLVPGTATWIPYNRFAGIDDSTSWINGDTVPVRNAQARNGKPTAADVFGTNSVTRLIDAPIPDCLMKADPRATRFGVFQFKQTLSSTARITDPLWPTGNANYPNGYGGTIADPVGPVEHAPVRFSGVGAAYYPATFCINNSTTDARDSATSTYADNDAVTRPADAIYPDPTANTKGKGSWTPYYYDSLNPTTSTVYRPIMLNRPFRNVAELGYAFRDLPWKTLDFFTDKSADAGLLDIFTINDGAPLFDTSNPPNIIGMAVPTTIAGKVNLSSTQAADLQSVLAGAILDELDSTNTVSNTGTGAIAAPVLAANIVNAVNPVASPSASPVQNTSELVSRTGLPQRILPTPTPTTNAVPNQVVKARREVVARAVSSVAQTRVWNLVIDVIAQTGRYPSNLLQNPQAADLPKFLVEGEKHYWVHVAIDRFTGQVIDKQIEKVAE